MQHRHTDFFDKAGPFTLRQIAEHVGATLLDDGAGARPIEDVRPLMTAGPGHLAFFDNRPTPSSSARPGRRCILARATPSAPPARSTLTPPAPYAPSPWRCSLFYMRRPPQQGRRRGAEPRHALVIRAPGSQEGAIIEPGAVVGREAVIGRGTTIAAGAVVGFRVVVGRDCYVGAGATLTHAIVGNGVIVHAGVRIGQDGFGFAGAKGT